MRLAGFLITLLGTWDMQHVCWWKKDIFWIENHTCRLCTFSKSSQFVQLAIQIKIFQCTFIYSCFVFLHRSPSQAFCKAFWLSVVSSVIRFSCRNGITPHNEGPHFFLSFFFNLCTSLHEITRAPTTTQILITDARIATGKQATFLVSFHIFLDPPTQTQLRELLNL